MTTCNATLTTATVSCEDDCHSTHHYKDHVELHTLKCDGGSTCFTDLRFGRNWHESGGTGTWFDDTPGATPHTPVSTVTDAEVEAAVRAIREAWRHEGRRNERMRAALEAFLAFRAAQENDR